MALTAASPDVLGNSGGGQLRPDHVSRSVLTECGELGFGTLHFGFPPVAGCRFGGPLGNGLATAGQDKADGGRHRPADAAEPQHECCNREDMEALAPEAQRQQWCCHFEDVGSDTGNRIGGLVYWGLPEGQSVLQVRGHAHSAEGGRGGVARQPENAVTRLNSW